VFSSIKEVLRWVKE